MEGTQRWDPPEHERLILVEMLCSSLCGLYVLLCQGTGLLPALCLAHLSLTGVSWPSSCFLILWYMYLWIEELCALRSLGSTNFIQDRCDLVVAFLWDQPEDTGRCWRLWVLWQPQCNRHCAVRYKTRHWEVIPGLSESLLEKSCTEAFGNRLELVEGNVHAGCVMQRRVI